MLQALCGYVLRVFSLDYRALAVLRILLGVIVIYDVVLGMRFLVPFHTDLGIMPLDILFSNYPDENIWAFHSISNNYRYQVILFSLHMIVAVLFTIGWRTKEMTVILRMFVCSMLGHNPQIINGADIVVKMMLFRSMFLPLSARWSIDYMKQKSKNFESLDTHRQSYMTTSNVCNRGTVAVIMQLGVIYICTGVLKSDPIWTTEYTATYYALSLDTFVKPLGALLYQFPEVMKAFTRGSLNLELYGMFLLFIPRRNKAWRMITVLLFVLFHFGLYLTMRLETFPWIMIAAWISLLPSVFWTHLARRSEPILIRIPGYARAVEYFGIPEVDTTIYVSQVTNNSVESSKDENIHMDISIDGFPVYVQKYRWYITVFVILCIGYVLSWNIRTTDFDRHDDRFPRDVNRFGFLLRLDQYRNMFSPFPFVDDGWTVIRGIQDSGNEVNLLDHDAPVSFDKPKFGGTIYEHEKRRKVFTNLRMKSNSQYREPMAQYFCRKRNESHSVAEQVETVQRYYILEKTLADYKTAPLEEVLLYEEDCFDAQ